MKENKKVFSKYVMSFTDENDVLKITTLHDSKGDECLFSNTFYNNNKEYLDTFENIMEWVKPKREIVKKNNIVINLDDYSVHYSSSQEKIKEEDLKQCIRIIKNELVEKNPEIAKHKALLIKYNNDIKTLEELENSDSTFDFGDEKEEIAKKIEDTKKTIDDLLNIQDIE